MPTWAGTPVPIGRMLGQVDQDDPTNLPVGCAAVCKNVDFTRDATGAGLSAATRAGNCLIAQGAKSPGTGLWDFQYEPESANDPFFQQVIRFTQSGVLERESPVGTGRMIPVPAGPSRVTLLYQPPWVLSVSFWVGLAGWFGIAATGLAWLFRDPPLPPAPV